VLISKYFHTISTTLFVKIPYGFLLLHMVIVNPNTGLKERTKSANKLFERTRKTAQLKSDIIHKRFPQPVILESKIEN